ncbi:MAG: TolC family protein [Xanthomonadales bacterium]|nr:TolC family protein [Xanthomonadales bacterium]
MMFQLLLILLGGVLASAAEPDSLGLAEAEKLALEADPTTRALLARSSASQEAAVAAGQLPDPKLKLAALALPVDTFDLDQEPMTQLQFGVVQQFPPGRTLDLQQRQMSSRAESFGDRAQARRLEVLRAVRLTLSEVAAEVEMRDILAASRDVLVELHGLIEDYYGTGRAEQQQVYRAALEASRVEERLAAVAQAEAEARARLSMWIGEAAYRPLADTWPPMEEPAAAARILADLPDHPVLLAQDHEIEAAETAVDIANQQYKPGFSVEVSYGDRNGRDLTGRDLPDFVSAMVMVDLPVFRDKRQDRRLAASRDELDAALEGRLEILRMLRRDVNESAARLRQVRERLERFREILLPQAADNREAALDAYRTAVGDLTELMRAQITEYELKLEYARLKRDELKARAQLLYLEGRS